MRFVMLLVLAATLLTQAGCSTTLEEAAGFAQKNLMAPKPVQEDKWAKATKKITCYDGDGKVVKQPIRVEEHAILSRDLDLGAIPVDPLIVTPVTEEKPGDAASQLP